MKTEPIPVIHESAGDLFTADGSRIARLSALGEKYAEFICRACNSRDKLLEALQKIVDAESRCCPRCEGIGRLWADGKPHYPSEQRDTIPCGNCGGSGYLQPENAQDIAFAAIALAEKGSG